jgi:transposase
MTGPSTSKGASANCSPTPSGCRSAWRSPAPPCRIARRPPGGFCPPGRGLGRACAGFWADQGYKSAPLQRALQPAAELEFVGAAANQKGFAVQPKRWRVEATFAGAMNWRRRRSDYESDPLHSRAFFQAAFTGLLLNRICR